MSTSIDQAHELIPTLDAIHKVLDDRCWSPDTLEEIADILRRAGYQIRSPDDIARGNGTGTDHGRSTMADMPGEDCYGFHVRVVREGDVRDGQVGWAVGRRNDLLELHFPNGWVRIYPDEDVKRESND